MADILYTRKISPDQKKEINEILENSEGKNMLDIFREIINPTAEECLAINYQDEGEARYKKVRSDREYEKFPVEYIVWLAIIDRNAIRKAYEKRKKQPPEEPKPKGKWDHLK